MYVHVFLLFLCLWLINRHCLYLYIFGVIDGNSFNILSCCLNQLPFLPSYILKNMCVCMCIMCVHVHVCDCGCTCAMVPMLKSEGNPRCWSSSSPMFQVGSFVVYYLWGQGGLHILGGSSDWRSSGGADVGYSLWLCVGSGDNRLRPSFFSIKCITHWTLPSVSLTFLLVVYQSSPKLLWILENTCYCLL